MRSRSCRSVTGWCTAFAKDRELISRSYLQPRTRSLGLGWMCHRASCHPSRIKPRPIQCSTVEMLRQKHRSKDHGRQKHGYHIVQTGVPDGTRGVVHRSRGHKGAVGTPPDRSNCEDGFLWRHSAREPNARKQRHKDDQPSSRYHRRRCSICSLDAIKTSVVPAP